jgi:hypothetical protein
LPLLLLCASACLCFGLSSGLLFGCGALTLFFLTLPRRCFFAPACGFGFDALSLFLYATALFGFGLKPRFFFGAFALIFDALTLFFST